jgi:hypothetical protein
MILDMTGRPAPGQEVRRCIVMVRFVVRITTPSLLHFLTARFAQVFHGQQVPPMAIGMDVPLDGNLILTTHDGVLRAAPMVFDPAGVGMEHPDLNASIVGHQPCVQNAVRVARSLMGIPVETILYPSDVVQAPEPVPTPESDITNNHGEHQDDQ